MKTEVVYTAHAVKDLTRLDKLVARIIVAKIAQYAQEKNPLKHAKKLNPPFDDLFRFRIGDYRAVFEIDRNGTVIILTILTVKHRKDVYRL